MDEENKSSIIPPTVLDTGDETEPYGEDTEEEIEEEIEYEDDLPIEESPVILNFSHPYRRTLPVPETTKENKSVPILATCLICMENIVNTITFPCNHAVMCVTCSQDYGKIQNVCPYCRTALLSIERMYLIYKAQPNKRPLEDDKISQSSKKLKSN